jgi:T-complex protein 1 subunit epsilon
LVEESLRLLEKGLHPLKIASGFDKAADKVIEHLETLKEKKEFVTREDLISASKIALSSKVVSSCKEHLS